MKEYKGATKKIKKAMIDADMNAKDIARELGMSNERSFYESLRRDTFSYEKVERIADILDCDIVLVNRKTGQTY